MENTSMEPNRPTRGERCVGYPLVALLLAVVFISTGMTGANCDTAILDPGGVTCDPGTGTPPSLLDTDHVLGSADALLTVFEYADFQCPFCGRFARSEFSTIKQKYIDTGKVRWVFRHFPLTSIHDRAEPAARASECANEQDPDQFFDYHDLVFADQDDLSDTRLKQHATTLGFDRNAFDACLDGNSHADRVQQDVNSGTALGVTGTPTFFVGGQKVTGFQTADQLGKIIDCQLEALSGG